MDMIGKWAPGAGYGPVLPAVDLYLLKQPLTLHPILRHEFAEFHLLLNFASGECGGYNPAVDERADLPLDAHRGAPATLPRVQALYVISRHSPWCTAVRNDAGVTIGDVVDALLKDYCEHTVNEFEWARLAPRHQDAVRRVAQAHVMHAADAGYGYDGRAHARRPSAQAQSAIRRADWLRERVFFDGLERQDEYAATRLGYKAPDVFVMNLTA